METYRRKTRKHSTIEALTEAQKIIFAPLTFQAIGTMLDIGILQSLDKNPNTVENLMKELNLNEYTVKTLLETAESTNIVTRNDDIFSVTQTGKSFLYDKMTIANFNFIKDCCYLGASEMTASFLQEKPMGLKKFFKDSDTIYPQLPNMSEKFQKSWYEFDNYYSDNCFDIIYKIISADNPAKIFDIGGNTGKFERVCLSNNPNIDITMLDLKENIDVVSKQLEGCKFYPINILDENAQMPKFSGAVLMSQFLDCFSKPQIISILKRIKASAETGTLIYILEPFTDNQIFDGARLSLVHTSLYFTCMANGNSKMYTQKEMLEMVDKAGLKISNIFPAVGIHDYTLLECQVR